VHLILRNELARRSRRTEAKASIILLSFTVVYYFSIRAFFFGAFLQNYAEPPSLTKSLPYHAKIFTYGPNFAK
jgi:hypothetical protein